jgi:hypothetical protein
MSRPRITLSPFPLAGVILFVVGLLLALPISIVGNVYAGELLLALIALIGLIAGSREPAFFTRGFWPFIGLFFLSLCAYILTDLTLGTPFHDAFRGWGRFAFILLDTPSAENPATTFSRFLSAMPWAKSSFTRSLTLETRLRSISGNTISACRFCSLFCVRWRSARCGPRSSGASSFS